MRLTISFKKKSLKLSDLLKADTLSQIALFMFLCSEMLRNLFEYLLGEGRLNIYFTIFLCYLPVVFILLSRQFKAYDFLALLAVIMAAFGLTYLMHPEYDYYFTRPTYGVLYRVLRADRAIYGYLFIRLNLNTKSIWSVLKKSSYVLMIYYMIQLINVMRVGYWMDYNYRGLYVTRTYSLNYGYNVLFPTLVFLHLAVKENKLRYYIGSIIGIIAIFMGGSRGPFICVAIFLLLVVLVNYKYWTRNYTVIFIGCTAILVGIYFVFGDGIQLIINILDSLDISSRTLVKLLEGSMTDDNGRNDIWNAAIAMVKDGGLFGYGMYGDRPVISAYHYAGYSHQIFLEILICFGVPIGCLLIFIMLYSSLKMIFFCQDDEWRSIFLIFFACSTQLILSMSFWYVNYFWLAIGVVVNYRKQYLNKRKYKLSLKG